MREPKIPPMKIKVQHTIRIKGLGRTVIATIFIAAAVQALNKELNKIVREHEGDIVNAAERFGEKVGDETIADRVKEAFNSTKPKADEKDNKDEPA